MSKEEKNKCPLCGSEASSEIRPGMMISCRCDICGDFVMEHLLSYTLRDKKDIRRKLSAWIRDIKERGEDPPELTKDNYSAILGSIPDYSVLEKQERLLSVIARRSDYPGAAVRLTSYTDYPLAWADNPKEFSFYMKSFVERGLVKGSIDDTWENYKIYITPEGWEYLEKSMKRPIETIQAFVAMSFSDKMESVYGNAIYPAIDKAGYRPYKVDREPHIDRIDVKIIAEIKNSRFLVADVTEQKAGVYFEAGYAMGIGLPVIWSVKKEDLDNVHFDTRQYNHIVWETEEELRETLYNFICAVIGKRRT